jgi:hypothetical protein
MHVCFGWLKERKKIQRFLEWTRVIKDKHCTEGAGLKSSVEMRQTYHMTQQEDIEGRVRTFGHEITGREQAWESKNLLM